MLNVNVICVGVVVLFKNIFDSNIPSLAVYFVNNLIVYYVERKNGYELITTNLM